MIPPRQPPVASDAAKRRPEADPWELPDVERREADRQARCELARDLGLGPGRHGPDD